MNSEQLCRIFTHINVQCHSHIPRKIILFWIYFELFVTAKNIQVNIIPKQVIHVYKKWFVSLSDLSFSLYTCKLRFVTLFLKEEKVGPQRTIACSNAWDIIGQKNTTPLNSEISWVKQFSWVDELHFQAQGHMNSEGRRNNLHKFYTAWWKGVTIHEPWCLK